MADILELRCSVCGRSYQAKEVAYTCPVCGPVGTLDVLYDYSALAVQLDRETLRNQPYSMWRYKMLLPVLSDTEAPPLRVGFTPLYDAPRAAESLGVHRAWVKDDGANPTGSLKDRASALVVARAMQQGIPVVSTASTGNAAAALAGIAASVGMKVIIFVPAAAPEAKIAQLLVYGAAVLLVEGTYDDAFDLCYAACQSEGWYCRNTGINPYTVEGKKTAAFEIAEQLNWNVPDVVVVSVGDGNIIAGVYKGFYDLYQLGWIERIPRLIGVQAEGSAALFKAWKEGTRAEDMQPIAAQTVADSISAGLPRDRARALRAVRQTQGAFVTVSDKQIIGAIPALARSTGVFAEPAAAAVFAGAQAAVQSGMIGAAESVLLLVTGNGLKDVRRAQESVAGGLRVQPTLDSVRQALNL
ncbi:MAG: threonine synthase [Chloroflexi bacterium]|nr:threonine synthase [Chloroflexota bacterium]MDL1884564.1 threonine synthase [Anaerolineae bacterium CFX8]